MAEGQDIQITHKDSLQLYIKTDVIEEKYGVSYVGEFCLTLKREAGDDPVIWANFPAMIFWQEEPHPEGSNYMALYRCPLRDEWMIADGFHAVHDYEGNPIKFPAVVELIGNEFYAIYSAYRHDYQSSNETMIDGGRDYVKSSGHDITHFIVEKGKIIVDSSTD
jgi:hypothetical protein